MLHAVCARVCVCLRAGELDDLGFGAGSAVMFDATSAPLLLVPKEHKPPGGGGGGHVSRDVYEDLMPGKST
jgi:hypothetical protein